MTATKGTQFMPETLAELVEAEGTTQFLFRVHANVDWRSELSGGRLRTEPGRPPEVVQVEKEHKVVKARFLTSEIKDPWQQYLPLRLSQKPQQADEKKPKSVLRVNSTFVHVYHLEKETPELKQIEEELGQKREAVARGEKRKLDAVSRERAAAEEKKIVAQKRFKLTSTAQALKQINFCVEEEAEPPADTQAAQVDDGIMKLIPLQQGHSAGYMVPVGFWTASPLKDTRDQVEIKWKGGRESFPVTLLCSPQANFLAKQVKRTSSRYRYILGLKPAGVKKVLLEEATILRIVPEKKISEAEAAALKQSYGELKGAAVHEFGTKARERQSNAVAARKARDFTIAEFGDYKAELHVRAEQLAARVVSNENRDAELKAKLVPPFNSQATSPEDVYSKSLDKIAPSHLLLREENLVSPNLRELLFMDLAKQTQAVHDREQAREFKLTKKELPEFAVHFALRSRFAACVLKKRAQAGLDSSSEEIAAKFGVLEKLVSMVARGMLFKGGKTRPEAVAELLDMNTSSELCWVWHKEYYDEQQDKVKIRTFNGRRTLCYLMVWALHLVPDFELTVPLAAEREVGSGPGTFKQALTYIGCTVTEQKQIGTDVPGSEASKLLVAKLKGPPQVNEKFYSMTEKMLSKKGKKKD